MAVAAFGLLAYDLDHGGLRKTYYGLLRLFLGLDLGWLLLWCTPIARNDSDIAGQCERASFRNSIKWSLACSFLGFFLHLASLDAWRKASEFSREASFVAPPAPGGASGGAGGGAAHLQADSAGKGYGSL